MKIGLVLPTYPNYSETFFHSQISGLIQSGFNVSLYINSDTNKKESLPENVEVVVQINTNNWMKILCILLILLINHPVNVYRFIRLEKLSTHRIYTILKHIILNAHILNQKLDWLHFGFATMAIQRENVAKAIGAKSAVSFRGFDIGLYPYQYTGCYTM